MKDRWFYDPRYDPSCLHRRSFLKAVVSIGGMEALDACRTYEWMPEEEASTERQGLLGNPARSRSNQPERQHAWNSYQRTHKKLGYIPPRHHVLLLMDYIGGDMNYDSAVVESALSKLEEAFKWSADGLLWNMGYSPYYFNKIGGEPPDRLPNPRRISELENPTFDKADISLHLASDNADSVLEAEEAFLGDLDQINGVRFSEDLDNILDVYERRTGFVGPSLPYDNQGVEGIPDDKPVDEEAPRYMGFHSGHTLQPGHPDFVEGEIQMHNQPTEDRVTITDGGLYEGGTTQQVSKISLDLHDWYDDFEIRERAQRLFDGFADMDRIGDVGQKATEFRKFKDLTGRNAEEYGVVGHAEKTARAREQNTPLILRRDFNTTDNGEAGLHFVSLQRDIQDFIETRVAMDGQDISQEYDQINREDSNGILSFMNVETRANYIIPPKEERSLPH